MFYCSNQDNEMAHVVSYNRKDYDVGDHLQEQRTFKKFNGHCAINMDSPSTTDNQDTAAITWKGFKGTQPIGKFRSKIASVNVEWKNITMTTKEDVDILKGLSGSIRSGELTAIMGPSGAGKSSLLNVLSGFTRQKVSGQILVNGFNREIRVFRKLNCYILQDDHLLPMLTVREIVTIAACLKISSSMSWQERQNTVDNCLHSLGLMSQQDKRVNQLSGGQRKRVCIAQELVSNPPLIFLDEPTSGLDSSSCFQCIQLLKTLSEEGRTVVCSIHQPSSKIFETFDKLYMLSEGQCIYRGSTENLVPFLATQGLECPRYHNPTDYVTEIAMGEYGDWNKRLVVAINDINEDSTANCLPEAEAGQKMHVPASNDSLPRKNAQTSANLETKGYATSSFQQFRMLFYRRLLCLLREPMNTHLRLIGNVVVGLLVGTLFYDIGNDATKVFNNSSLMFSILIFLIFAAKMPTILTFPMERIIFEREHMNSWYCTSMYYLATSAAEIPFQILFPIINCSIVYWMSGQPADISRFSLFLLSAVLLSLVSQSVGLLIGAGVDVQKGVYITSVIAMPTLLFCNFFITMSSIPPCLHWISYCSYARYAFRSMLMTLYSMNRQPLDCSKDPNNTTHCHFEDPATIIKELDIEGDLYVEYSTLLGFFLFFRIATFFVLKFRVVRTRWMNI